MRQGRAIESAQYLRLIETSIEEAKKESVFFANRIRGIMAGFWMDFLRVLFKQFRL